MPYSKYLHATTADEKSRRDAGLRGSHYAPLLAAMQKTWIPMRGCRGKTLRAAEWSACRLISSKLDENDAAILVMDKQRQPCGKTLIYRDAAEGFARAT